MAQARNRLAPHQPIMDSRRRTAASSRITVPPTDAGISKIDNSRPAKLKTDAAAAPPKEHV